MKILFTVEFYEPHKGGAQEVVKQIAERLKTKGHEVTVATSYLKNRKTNLINGVRIEQFKISGNNVRKIKGEKAEQERYKQLLLGDFDCVINYAAQNWTTDLCFPVLSKINCKKILVPCGYSGLNNPKYKKYFNELPEYLEKYDLLVHLSPSYQDKIFDDKAGFAKKSVIIPNGAAEEEFSSPCTVDIKNKLGLSTRYLIICVANHYKDKGHDFVIKAFRKIGRNDSSLVIIGANASIRGCYKNCLLKSKIFRNIILMNGNNRAEVLSAYKAADLFLFGSKVECAPLVLYESFASKTPFISTPVGNVPDYKDFVKIVNTPEEMAVAANFLLDHEEESKKIALAGYNLWKEKYTWDKIADEYEKIIK
jgi:glycosyltransferase involved in cell wall biosynthesis